MNVTSAASLTQKITLLAITESKEDYEPRLKSSLEGKSGGAGMEEMDVPILLVSNNHIDKP